MTHRQKDIGDDEIRIISSDSRNSSSAPRSGKHTALWIVTAILLIAGAGFCALFFSLTSDPDFDAEIVSVDPAPVPTIAKAKASTDSIITATAFTNVVDTVVNGAKLSILTPVNSIPMLVIGNDALNDTSAILVAQAADIRSDNGKIAGAFVINGELMSKGEAKAGFCSIINNEISIGVADATPMLEQALMQGGYFFRQYPLVVGGQIIENKPKGKALRKALAELHGRICVITTRNRLSFHDFSQALVDLGVRNAIYLVGAESCGFYIDENGNRTTLGQKPRSDQENVNYIVWKQR